MITISYHPTKRDLIKASYVALRARPIIFAFSISFFIALPLGLAFFSIAANIHGASIAISNILNLILTPPLALIFFGGQILWQTRGAVSLQGTHTYEFTDEDIHLKGPGFDNRIDWKLVTRCHRATQGLLFMSGNAPLISVPARTLSNASQNEMNRMLSAKGITLTGKWKDAAEPRA